VGEPLKRNVIRLTIMKPGILILFVEACLMFGISIRAQSSQTDGSYEAAIASLSENSDAAQVASATAALENAGTKAFPALLAHLNDTARASVVFQRAVMEVDAKGNVIGIHHPTIGEVCFDLIQGQIEGNWPKGFREFYVLSSENVVDWWQARKEKTLKELQLETAQASLTRACQRRGKSGYSREAVRFLERHLRELKVAKS
jgi:hypothetical protein